MSYELSPGDKIYLIDEEKFILTGVIESRTSCRSLLDLENYDSYLVRIYKKNNYRGVYNLKWYKWAHTKEELMAKLKQD